MRRWSSRTLRLPPALLPPGLVAGHGGALARLAGVVGEAEGERSTPCGSACGWRRAPSRAGPDDGLRRGRRRTRGSRAAVLALARRGDGLLPSPHGRLCNHCHNLAATLNSSSAQSSVGGDRWPLRHGLTLRQWRRRWRSNSRSKDLDPPTRKQESRRRQGRQHGVKPCLACQSRRAKLSAHKLDRVHTPASKTNHTKTMKHIIANQAKQMRIRRRHKLTSLSRPSRAKPGQGRTPPQLLCLTPQVARNECAS